MPSLSRAKEAGFLALAALLALAVARILPRELATLPGKEITLIPAGLAFVAGVGYLAIVQPRTAFVLAFALIGFVRIEPAPVDAVFCMLIVTSFALGRAKPRVPAWIGLPLAVFAIVSLISMVNAIDIQRAVRFEFITLYAVALAVWLSWAFTNPDWTRLGITTYIYVAIASGALGPLALYTPLPDRSSLTYGGVRALGLFKDPNVYSAFLVPAAVILLEEVTSPRLLLRWRRSTRLIAFGVVGSGLVVAYSRAAWLNFVIAASALVVILALRRGGAKRALGSIAVLVSGGAIGLILLSVTGSLSFFQERSHLQSYDQSRFSNQGSAIDDVTRHVFGYGPGQAEVRLPLSTHSTFARAAFEQGLLGISALVLVLACTLISALILARRRPDVHGVGTAALLGIWLGLIVNSIFIDTLHWRHLWVFAGLIWCGYAMSVRPDADRPRPEPPGKTG